MIATCHWKENEGGYYWESECGRMFSFTCGNDFDWCPYCGCEMDRKVHLSAEDIEAEKADRAHQEMKDMEP